MIQYINILTCEGKSLLFRNYGSSDIDRDFFVGFSNFIEEISQSDIKSTATDEFKYYYTLVDEIIIVVCTDLEEEDAAVNSKITSIKVKFIEGYGYILARGDLLGNRSFFAGFGRELDEIIMDPIKVAIIGMGGCGKTDLLRLICGTDVNLEYQPTINVDISNFDGTEIGINRSITLWDFAGQSNFRSLWKSLLDNTDIALLVLDSTYETLNPTKEIFREILDKHFKDKLVIGIANNQDMPNRLTPIFIERFLSETGWDPPIRVHGMVATDPAYREKILTILRDAVDKIKITEN